jgi:hypothetical protein
MGPQGPAGSKAAGPCYNNDQDRYQDCNNGTVTDTVTGLIWLKQANCFGEKPWSLANQAAAGLASGTCGLSDGSSAGDWRLPTAAEWGATVAQAHDMHCQAPVLTDTYGGNCYNTATTPPFLDVGGRYWSSETYAPAPTSAWDMELDDAGAAGLPGKDISDLVWPVRSGR